MTAKNLGIEVPESFIVTTEGDEEALLFATKRYDRNDIDFTTSQFSDIVDSGA